VSCQIFLDPNLKRQLRALRKAGGRSLLIAEHAESIMARSVFTGDADPKQAGRCTKRGEIRVKKSIKFDLIESYRLLGMKKGQDILFLFIGTHDECDRWVGNKKGRRLILRKEGADTLSIHYPMPQEETGEEEADPDDILDDDYLMASFDEKLLRELFHGLVGSK
jgi:hypothetical protein